jgi:pimeloyl-ACP methyl ester carboxylesterase
MARSPELGTEHKVELSPGAIRYRERGEGEAIVFVHPMILNGDLWRKVVPPLAHEFRCITPDWPLGGHALAMNPDADLTPPAIAKLIAEFLEAINLDEVTLVGNDTGGAFAQLVAAHHPQRLRRLVLVTCDAFDNFPPRMAKALVLFAHTPGSVRLARALTRSRRVRRSPLVFGWVTKRPFEPEIEDSYLERILDDPDIQRDARKALRGLSARHTLAAAQRLPQFDRPALVVWAPEDRFFPVAHAHRLAELLPDARLELVDDCYTFMGEDQPERLAELIADFIRETAPAPA